MNDTARLGDAATRPDIDMQAAAAIVEAWWADHFPGSPVAQVTAAWNHAFGAKEDLKRRLVNLVQGGL